MIEVNLLELTGSFAENKDKAKDIRIDNIMPTLKDGGDVTLNFSGVGSTTQSFIHALISDPIRQFGGDILDRIIFKNCNDKIQKIIGIVTDYMQESA